MISPIKIWRNQKKVQKQINKEGVIVSWTLIRVAPLDWKAHAPYPVAIVRLSDDSVISAKVVDYNNKHLVVGQKVITVLRRIRMPTREGIIPYGIKVKPKR